MATLAPFYADEELLTGPTGRLLISNGTPIATPTKNNNGGGKIGLGPAVLRQRGKTVSADFSGTFPDNYNGKTNPKFDFGPVTLEAVSGDTITTVGTVDYADMAAGDARGWIFDFDLPTPTRNGSRTNATFRLVHADVGIVLDETDYYFVSNQQAIYGEQHGTGDAFRESGGAEPATVGSTASGQQLAGESCPPITVWQYRSIPLQSPGNAEVNAIDFRPGDPISVDTSQPGNYLLTFTINGKANPAPGGYPPKSYLTFQNPPYITNAPSISLRILPNDEDFSPYYVDPSSDEPVGNDLLTFDVVYAKVLRTYYLLFPAMNQIFALNDEQAVAKHAQAILARTEMAFWMTTKLHAADPGHVSDPATLLRAWCRKVLIQGS